MLSLVEHEKSFITTDPVCYISTVLILYHELLLLEYNMSTLPTQAEWQSFLLRTVMKIYNVF